MSVCLFVKNCYCIKTTRQTEVVLARELLLIETVLSGNSGTSKSKGTYIFWLLYSVTLTFDSVTLPQTLRT